MTLEIDGKKETATAYNNKDGWPSVVESQGKQLYSVRTKGRKATLTYTVAPIPLEGATTLDAFDSELTEELKILGYMDD